MPSDYLRRKQNADNTRLQIGMELGAQRMQDNFCAILNDPDVMGKDTFGRKRLEKILAAVAELDAKHEKAYTDDKEADYHQEALDARLRRIWKDDLVPFAQRFPFLKQFGYDRGRKNWR